MFLEQQLPWEYMGIVDLDVTYFIQVGVFLLFAVIMYLLLFRPFLGIVDDRAKRTSGARALASEDDSEAKGLVADYEERLGKAVNEAAQIRSSQRGEARAEAQRTLQAARSEYDERMAAGSRAARDAYESARTDVEIHSRPLAEDIARKLLG